MARTAETLDSRLARVEEAIAGFKEDRIEARQDRKDIISRLDQLSQAVQSTGAAVQALSLEKCGERLDAHDKRLERIDQRLTDLETKTKNLPVIETEIMFWRRVLGGGMHATWKIGTFAIGSGAIGAAIVKLWH